MSILAKKLRAGSSKIEFVGGNTASKVGDTVGTTNISLTSGLTGGVDSAVKNGDLVIGIYGVASNGNATLYVEDSGGTDYTIIGSELWSNDDNDSNLHVAYKFVNGDTATYFGPTTHANNGGTMAVYVFRNVNPTTPIDVTTTTATGTNTGYPNPPAITPSTTGAVVVVTAMCTTSPTTFTTPGDLTNFFTVYQADTHSPLLGVGQKNNWVSGSFDPGSWTHGGFEGAALSWAAISFVLRPQFPG